MVLVLHRYMYKHYHEGKNEVKQMYMTLSPNEECDAALIVSLPGVAFRSAESEAALVCGC